MNGMEYLYKAAMLYRINKENNTEIYADELADQNQDMQIEEKTASMSQPAIRKDMISKLKAALSVKDPLAQVAGSRQDTIKDMIGKIKNALNKSAAVEKSADELTDIYPDLQSKVELRRRRGESLSPESIMTETKALGKPSYEEYVKEISPYLRNAARSEDQYRYNNLGKRYSRAIDNDGPNGNRVDPYEGSVELTDINPRLINKPGVSSNLTEFTGKDYAKMHNIIKELKRNGGRLDINMQGDNLLDHFEWPLNQSTGSMRNIHRDFSNEVNNPGAALEGAVVNIPRIPRISEQNTLPIRPMPTPQRKPAPVPQEAPTQREPAPKLEAEASAPYLPKENAGRSIGVGDNSSPRGSRGI